MVQGIIAGGEKALVQAIEGAEDHSEEGANEIIKRGITSEVGFNTYFYLFLR